MRGAGELLQLVNEWIVYAENAVIIQRAYDYWVLGHGVEELEPRWSIIRNVLGWTE